MNFTVFSDAQQRKHCSGTILGVSDTVSFPVHVGVLIALRLPTNFIASGITVTKLMLNSFKYEAKIPTVPRL